MSALPRPAPIDAEREPVLPVACPEPTGTPRQRSRVVTARERSRDGISVVHPLSGSLQRLLPLHVEADTTGNGPGRRCGNCRHAADTGVADHPKCERTETRRVRNEDVCAPRYQAAGTACRSWWPGCTDHRWPRDPS